MGFRLAITSVAALLAAGSLVPQSAEATLRVRNQEQEAGVESTDLGNGIFMLSTGRAGNLAVLAGDDGIVLVDDQLPDTGPLIEGAVVEVAGAGAPRFLVNTHWHADHTGGNAHFADLGATIAAHHNVRRRLAEAEDEWIQPATLPIMTFGEDLTFHMNGQTVEVTHVPAAHTDGDAFVHFREADVLHLGDVFFSGRFPFIDLSAGGTVDGYIAAMERGLEIAGEDTRIIPGHGPLSGRSELRASVDMLREAAFRVRTLVEGGADLEALRDAAPLADLDADWSWGFITTDRMLQILYNDAVGNPYPFE